MRVATIVALVVCCCVALAPRAHAAEASSPFAWLGFGRTKTHAAKTTNASHAAAPQVFAKMGDGTKHFVSNTKNLFVPKKPPVKTRGVTATHHPQRPEPPKQSFFKRMFNPEPPPPPRTVGEWMSLEQVHP
jgi:hypothetical protein